MKDIKDFEGLYAATEDGQIWSYGNRNGTIKHGKFLSTYLDKDGYRKLSLKKDGKTFTKRVSRLILSTFKPNNCPEKTQVNHKNGIRTDDSIENLEWVTPAENIKHSFNCLNKDQKNTKNNAFNKWGYILNGDYTLIDDKTIDAWCTEQQTASTTIHTSIKENRELKRGKFKGYRFFKQSIEFGSTSTK